MIGYEDNGEDDASEFVHCLRHAIDVTAMRTIVQYLEVQESYPTLPTHLHPSPRLGGRGER